MDYMTLKEASERWCFPSDIRSEKVISNENFSYRR